MKPGKKLLASPRQSKLEMGCVRSEIQTIKEEASVNSRVQAKLS